VARWRRKRGGGEASGALVPNPVGSPPSSLGAEAPLPEDDVFD